MEKRIRVNELPSPTWRWLKMNETYVSNLEALEQKNAIIFVPTAVETGEIKRKNISDIKTALGQDMEMLMDDALECAESFVAPKEIAGPIRVDLEYQSEDKAASSYYIEAEDDAEIYVIMRFTGGAGKGIGAVQTKYKVGKNAKITMVQVQTLGDEFKFLNDIGGECEENGTFKLIQLILGAKETYVGSRTELLGAESNLETKVAYSTKCEDLLDMNYIANHHGEKTFCDIRVNGVMRDNSHKMFRGTIDFKRGCAGSTGSENEDILLLDEGVVNRTIPVILCTEEDVEGNHGASIGKLDENTMFYLTSRGIAEEDVIEMMAKARIDGVKNLIEDDQTIQYVDEYISGMGVN